MASKREIKHGLEGHAIKINCMTCFNELMQHCITEECSEGSACPLYPELYALLSKRLPSWELEMRFEKPDFEHIPNDSDYVEVSQ